MEGMPVSHDSDVVQDKPYDAPTSESLVDTGTCPMDRQPEAIRPSIDESAGMKGDEQKCVT
jgi:hypothetical protein